MRVLVIDGKYMRSKELMYTHLARVFSLPPYFGNNLDALWDWLNENNEPTKIEINNVELTQKYLGSYGKKFIDLLEKLEKENKNYKLCFM